MHAATRRLLVEIKLQHPATERTGIARPISSTTVDINGLSKILLRSPASIRKALSRAAHGEMNESGVPPARRIPGCRNMIWLVDEVMDWLRQQPVCTLARVRKQKKFDDVEVPTVPVMRGRPRKIHRHEKVSE